MNLLQQWQNDAPEDETKPGQDNGKIKAMNYPNPFNPDTNITYTLEEPAYVTMTVYNTNGQFVRTLVNGYKTEGTYQVTWDSKNYKGENVPSGMYFYNIIAGQEKLSKRMLLMK